MTFMMRGIVAAVLVACCLSSAVAQERDPEKARLAYQAAKEAYDRGNFRECIRRLEEAYRWAPHPNIRISIAKRWMDLDEPQRALQVLRAIDPKALPRKGRKGLEAEIAAVEAKLKTPVQVRIDSRPPGALVQLPGGAIMRAPAQRWLPRGEHSVVLTLDGHERVVRRIRVKGTKPMTFRFELPAVVGRLTVDLTEPDPNVVLTLDGHPVGHGSTHELSPGTHVVGCRRPGSEGQSMTVTVPEKRPMSVRCSVPARKPANWRTPVGWVSVGSGAAAIATGLALFITFAQEEERYKAPRYSVDSSKNLTGGIVTGLGAGLVGLGTYFLLTAK